jgi:hypothetical protein
VLALATLAAWCSAAPVARAAEPDRDACIQAYVEAQSARKAGKLLVARSRLEVCARATARGAICSTRPRPSTASRCRWTGACCRSIRGGTP